MALIQCTDCGKDHSDQAPACPTCGRPNRQALGAEPNDFLPAVNPAAANRKIWQPPGGKLALCALGAISAVAALFTVISPGNLNHTSTEASSRNVASASIETDQPPPGWAKTEMPGIYFNVCKSSQALPDCVAARSKLAEDVGLVVRFWCKKVACKDIYIEASQIADSGANLGWTNDSAYGERGDVVYLALQASVSSGGSEGSVVGFPAITKVLINGYSFKGFPLGIGRP